MSLSMLERMCLTLSTSCQQILGRYCQLVFQFEFQTLWNKFFSYASTEEVSSFIFESIYIFSAIFSLYLSVDCNSSEQCVVSSSPSSSSVDVEVCSTIIVEGSSSGFLFDRILLFPSFPSLAFVLKNIAH